MVSPDRPMMTIANACINKGIAEGVVRHWLRKGYITKGKIFTERLHRAPQIGVYTDELDTMIIKTQKKRDGRKLPNTIVNIELAQILKRRHYPSIPTKDVLQCPQCHLQMRNLYCINCLDVLTVPPIYPRMCQTCGEDLVKKSHEDPDDFADRSYCNSQCSKRYPRKWERFYQTNPTCLSKIRIERNLSRKEIAAESGINYATIMRIEKREIKSSRPEIIKKIAKILKVDIKEIASSAKRKSVRSSAKNAYMQWE